MVDDPHQSGGVTGFGASNTSDGQAASPMNGDRNLDAPQTHEQLIAHNSSLKTRVSELDLINELFRGRLSQLEQQEAAARRGQEVACVEQTQLRTKLDASEETVAQFRAQLEDSHRRENNLKRRLDELELELKEAKEALEAEPERPAKKPRLEEPSVKKEGLIADTSDVTDVAKVTSEIIEAADAEENTQSVDHENTVDTADAVEPVAEAEAAAS